jgi:hypothetical protein
VFGEIVVQDVAGYILEDERRYTDVALEVEGERLGQATLPWVRRLAALLPAPDLCQRSRRRISGPAQQDVHSIMPKRRAGWRSNTPPSTSTVRRNTDYDTREFTVIDPDGNMMLFGSSLMWA